MIFLSIFWLFLSFFDFWTLGIFRLTFHDRQSPAPIQHLKFPKVQKSKKLGKSQKILKKSQNKHKDFSNFCIYIYICLTFIFFCLILTLICWSEVEHSRSWNVNRNMKMITHLSVKKNDYAVEFEIYKKVGLGRRCDHIYIYIYIYIYIFLYLHIYFDRCFYVFVILLLYFLRRALCFLTWTRHCHIWCIRCVWYIAHTGSIFQKGSIW